MKIRINEPNYRANTSEINNTPKINPLVLVFELADGYQHCMTHFSAQRSMKKDPISLTVIQLKSMGSRMMWKKEQMQQFLDKWRVHYFDPDFNITKEDLYDTE